MPLRRRRLRKLLVLAGCLFGRPEGELALVGLVLVAAGAALHLWSKGCLEQNRRLTTAGPYRFTRHPFYLANALVDLGLLAVIGNAWIAALYVPLWIAAYHATIDREEERLRGLFPAEHADYVRRVPRLLPTGRSWPRDRAQGGFRLDNPALARGSEYARVMGFGLATAALFAAARIRTLGLDLFDPRHATALFGIVLLLVGWVVKLALAETFRRPETRLLPFTGRPALRGAITLALGGLAVLGNVGLLGGGVGERLWLAAAPIGWVALLALDALGRARVGVAGRVGAPRWRLLPAVFAGALGTAVLLLGGPRL